MGTCLPFNPKERFLAKKKKVFTTSLTFYPFFLILSMGISWPLLGPNQCFQKRTCCPTTVWRVLTTTTEAVRWVSWSEFGLRIQQPLPLASYSPWTDFPEVTVAPRFSILFFILNFFSTFLFFFRAMSQVQDISLKLITLYEHLLVNLAWKSVLLDYMSKIIQIDQKWQQFW